MKFYDLDVPPMTEERREAIKYVVNHWMVTRNDRNGVTLEWTPCGPDCRHTPPTDE